MNRIISWKGILAALIIGFALAAALVGPMTAARPLPPPVIKRVPLYTADVLDTGLACVYAWDGSVYEWSRENLDIAITARCPTRAAARARYELSEVTPERIRPSDLVAP